MGISWQVALGCVFIDGLILVVLTLTRFRQALIDALPASIKYGIACGIGMLVVLIIGFIDAGLVVGHPVTLITLGDVLSPPTLLAIFGLFITSILRIMNIKGAILWGIRFLYLKTI